MKRNCLRPPLILALVAVLGLSAAACGSADDKTVASVGSATLSQEQFEAIAESKGTEDTSAEGVSGLSKVDKADAADHISEWIYYESWIDLAAEGGTEINGLHIELARQNYEVATDQDSSLPAADTPYGLILQRYAAVPHLIADHIVAVGDVTALCSSHLLVETEADAAAAVSRLDAGEDFAALAAEVSVGPSGPSGGDLGCIAPGALVPEFVEGAAAVGGPGISEPVQSQFGWHVIEVRSFGPVVRGEHPELAAEQITPFVLNNQGADFQRLQAMLFDRDISVDPRFGVFDPALGQVSTGSDATAG